jgi:putative tryptophan/tyrosine transport system substrate-binding protein
MKRRQFIAGLGSAVAWPLVARAQQPQRMRRIGVLMNLASDDPESANRAAALAQGLAELGWTVGRNVQIVYRWGGDDIDRIRALAQELVGLRPDSILASSAVATAALQRETRTIPFVFAGVTDPVARGIVARLDRPSGNITGFANYEAT